MTSTLYEKDFYAWTMQTVKALRERAFDNLDIDHLAEEVESMGKSDFRELKKSFNCAYCALIGVGISRKSKKLKLARNYQRTA
ncbi:DUF29 domain-containing protein [Caedibacter taeniospiralis]|uniref:DUF29 domain-containing protein n=1 Tax=Caedibacter taeniospiralis TaxID=28907 RepID=UPI0018EF3259